MRRTLPTLLLASLLLAACGGGGGGSSASNGEASKPAATVLADAKQAATHAKSVHLSGTIVANGQKISLDLRIANGKGATGSMTLGGANVQMVVVGGKAYIQASDAFYKQMAGARGAAVAQLLHGKWLALPTSSGEGASFAQFTSLGQLFSQVSASPGTLQNKGVTTYNGQQAVAIYSPTKHGTLYVSPTGKPYPIAMVAGSKGAITFGDWDANVSIAAPSNAVDLSKLGG